MRVLISIIVICLGTSSLAATKTGTIRVSDVLTNVHIFNLYAYDSITYDDVPGFTGSYSTSDLNDPFLQVAGLPAWIFATSGSADYISYEDKTAAYSNCKGILSTLCSFASVRLFSYDNSSNFGASAADGSSSGGVSASNSNLYYQGEMDNSWVFDGIGYGGTPIALDVRSTYVGGIVPTPLPSSGVLVAGTLAGFGAAKRLARRNRRLTATA